MNNNIHSQQNNNALLVNNNNNNNNHLNDSISDQPDPDYIKMFVGQVPRSMDEAQLKEMFEEFGRVHQINVLRDKVTGLSKGEYSHFSHICLPASTVTNRSCCTLSKVISLVENLQYGVWCDVCLLVCATRVCDNQSILSWWLFRCHVFLLCTTHDAVVAISVIPAVITMESRTDQRSAANLADGS